MISIETIDEFRRRTNSSYDDARYFLERHNGDLLEAIIDFEKARNSSHSHNCCGYRESHRGDFGGAVKKIVQKLLDVKVTVTDKTARTVNFPILIPILLCPVWHVMVILAILMMIMGFRFSIREIQDENYNLDNIIGKIKEKARARNF